jgi:hypothetical protein
MMPTFLKYFATGVVCAAIGFVLGRVYEEREVYRNRYRAQSALLAEILQNPRYARLQISEFSGGGASLSGLVDSREALEDLRRETALAIGKGEVPRALAGVEVRESK